MNTNEQVPKDLEIVMTQDAFNNPDLKEEVRPDSELKKWLIGYVGERTSPGSNEVTVENIVEVMATEFPEFLMAVAEENWVRGYHQALNDVDEGANLREQELQEKLNPETEEKVDEDG